MVMSNLSVYMDSCCFIDIVASGTGNFVPAGRDNIVWYYKRLLLASRDKEITVIKRLFDFAGIDDEALFAVWAFNVKLIVFGN